MRRGHLALITLHADPASPSGVGGGGGTHSYVRELMAGLPKSGWSVSVLTRWADPALPEREDVTPNVRIIRLRVGEVGPVDKRVLHDFHGISLAAAESALDSLPGADLLHSVYWNSGRVAMELSARLGLNFVHTVISNGWRRMHQGAADMPPSRVATERQVFASAFAIFCIAAQERSDLIEHYAVDPRKVVVVGRPVARSFRYPCRDEWGRAARPPLPGAGV